MTDAELAAMLAEEAGKLLIGLRTAEGARGAVLGRHADREANDFILARLRQWRPDDAVLSEESPDHDIRLGRERVWIVDPLDGTREYGEGRDDWAVHVALALGGKPVLGALALPAQDKLYRSDACPTPPHSPRERPLMLVSRTRPPPEAEALAAALDADIASIGSAGAKAAAVIAGEADIYFHAGGQHEWDNCAPAAVALGAGLHASRADGSPLRYNNADTLVPDLVIARPELGQRAVDFCRSQR
ncbi:MAG: 3'(2'),5'-bisphosphate nucleotidase CysQ [Sphingosinicella sp.]